MSGSPAIEAGVASTRRWRGNNRVQRRKTPSQGAYELATLKTAVA